MGSLIARQSRREILLEVADVHGERLFQLGDARLGDRDVDRSTVLRAVLASNEAGFLQAVDQSGRTAGRVDDRVRHLVIVILPPSLLLNCKSTSNQARGI